MQRNVKLISLSLTLFRVSVVHWRTVYWKPLIQIAHSSNINIFTEMPDISAKKSIITGHRTHRRTFIVTREVIPLKEQNYHPVSQFHRIRCNVWLLKTTEMFPLYLNNKKKGGEGGAEGEEYQRLNTSISENHFSYISITLVWEPGDHWLWSRNIVHLYLWMYML